MRNTKIALAVLALVASTAAMAQATVYGNLDASLASQTNGNLNFDGTGNWNGTNMGVKGSEDLENGMKATYQLEMGLNLSNGGQANGGTGGATQAAGIFNRQANIGLAGDFGSVKAGLQLSPFIAAALNGVANSNESFYVPLLVMAGDRTLNYAGNNGTTGNNNLSGGFFVPNAVSFTTPSVGGFTASALSRLKNAVTTDKYDAYSLTYAAGDISVAAAYQGVNNSAAGASSGMVVNGAYQMGPARLVAGYHKYSVDSTNASLNTYNVGASYEVVANTAVSLQYAKNNATNSATIINLGLQHNLSKTTYLYATASRGTNGAGVLYSSFVATAMGGASTTTTNGYAVGMVKSF
jgi:predicted porin